MQVLHVCPDDQFMQFISTVFEEVSPGISRYIVISASSELRHPPESPNVRILRPDLLGLPQVASEARRSSAVIVHGMSMQGAVAFRAAHNHTVKVWSGWGHDYYGLDSRGNSDLLGPQTRELASVLAERSGPRDIARRLFLATQRRMWNQAASACDLFSAPIPNDFTVFQERFPHSRSAYAQLNYGDVETTFAGTGSPSGANVLVGNSASLSNNHLEAFDVLAELDPNADSVIVPLTYGDPQYREHIVAEGRRRLGKAFCPVTQHLPLDEWLEVVASCNTVVMNHRRQQAMGNIIAALNAGAFVFMNSRSPAYVFLRDLGAHVYTTGELPTRGLSRLRVSPSELRDTRAALATFWSREQVLKNIERMVTLLLPGV